MPKRRKILDGPSVCTCNVYPFPHRPGGGKCADPVGLGEHEPSGAGFMQDVDSIEHLIDIKAGLARKLPRRPNEP